MTKEIVFLVNTDTRRVTGGIRFIYRVAEALHSAGMAVSISSCSENLPIDVAGEPFKCRALTLPQAASIAPSQRIFVAPDDVLLRRRLAEDVNGVNFDIGAGHFVILSQNRRDIMESFVQVWPKQLRGLSLANNPNCLGHLTVSAHEQAIWREIFPHLQGWTVPNSVDSTAFAPGAKKKIIAFAEKGQPETSQVRSALLLLRHARLLDGYAFRVLKGLSHDQVAAVLSEASVFLQTSLYESFGLTAAEAIASGCIFLGSDGGAHIPFLSDDWAYRCDPCDTLGLVQRMRALDHDMTHNPDLIEEKRAAGRSFIAKTYSPAQQIDQARRAFGDILQRARQ